MAKFLRASELCCGIITGLSGVGAPIVLQIRVNGLKYGLADFLLKIFVFSVLPALVCVGSYRHVISRKFWGKVLLFFSGSVIITLSYFYVFAFAWGGGVRVPVGLVFMTIVFTAFAMILSLFVGQ
jgi:hypothetical protein